MASQRIDGDFYDFFPHSDRCLDILVGDVMGKGIPAALWGAAAKSQFLDVLRRLVVQSDWHTLPDPEAIVSGVHAEISGELEKLETFITACYVRVDAERGRMDFVDCGHTGILHFRADQGICEMHKGNNLPLGFLTTEVYIQETQTLKPGDILLLFSDGLTENQDKHGGFFGEGPLMELVKTHHDSRPKEILNAIYEAAISFGEKTVFGDDLTFVVAKFSGLPDQRRVSQHRMEMGKNLRELPRVRKFIADALGELPNPSLSKKSLFLVQMAVHEAMAFIMDQGDAGDKARPVCLDAEVFSDTVSVKISYFGRRHFTGQRGFAERSEDPENQFMFFLMHESMDDVQFFCDVTQREVIRLIKRRGS